MKGIRVTEIAKEIKFKGVWGALEPKRGFQAQPATGYLRLTLVFMWGSALREGFSLCFSTGFC